MTSVNPFLMATALRRYKRMERIRRIFII